MLNILLHRYGLAGCSIALLVMALCLPSTEEVTGSTKIPLIVLTLHDHYHLLTLLKRTS